MKLYISEGAVWLLCIVYVPFIMYLMWKLWCALPKKFFLRIGITVLALLMAVAIPFWDVVITSINMAKLCPQAGIFINRSVKVEGFYTNLGSPDMLDHGFKYIESKSNDDHLVVYSKEGGVIKKEEFNAKNYQVKSQYEYIYDAESGAYKGREDIGVQKSVVRNRESSEVLGYALRYKAYPGWFDRNTVARIGQVLWMCHDHLDQEIQLRNQVLLPK